MFRALLLLLYAAVLAISLPTHAAQTARSPDFELRTWAMSGAAPADGEPLSESTSFVMRSRLGGPFVGHAESASFALWGCGAYTPVEAWFLVDATAEGPVVIRWTVESLGGAVGFNVYRATSEEGPFERANADLLPPDAPGEYVDTTVWPGTWYWYELRAAMPDGSEESVGSGPLAVETQGRLVTKLRGVSPNPFRATATVTHETATTAVRTRIAVYDVSGKVVRVLTDAPARPGRHEVTWDGTNEDGHRVASGVYFFALESGEVQDRQSVVLLR
jgi:hypothetical protein